MSSKLAHEGYSEATIRQLGSVLDSTYSSKKMEIDYSGLAVCPSVVVYATLAKNDVFCVAGQLYVGVNSTGNELVDIAAVTHEATHALDYIKDPLLYVCDKKDLSAATLTGFKSRLTLTRELKAYAVGDCVERYLAETHGSMERAALASHRVEAIRQEVNGPVTAKDAFAVHEDIIQRLEQAGLSYIYR